MLAFLELSSFKQENVKSSVKTAFGNKYRFQYQEYNGHWWFLLQRQLTNSELRPSLETFIHALALWSDFK